MRKILMSIRHGFLKFARQLHLYLGAFTAPALLFFAFTGALQTFGLHERHRGSDYQPPRWLVTMAQLHKKQTMDVPMRRLRPGAVAATTGSGPMAMRDAPRDEARRATKPAHNALPLKIFSALVSLGLMLSTLTGIYMAYRYTRNGRLVGAALIGGVLVPVVLAML